MSLQFIVAPSGFGKTTYLHRMIIDRASKYPQKNHIILVPEQFNMQTQRDICLASPTKGILQIDVLSFARLAHRIFDEAGGNNLEMLGDVGKSMILRRVAEEKKDELSVLSGKMSKPGYVGEMKSIISEFMQYDITPSEVEDMITLSDDRPALASKLKDINTLYKGYNDFLAEKYITAEEVLDRAVSLADHAPFLASCDIYMDGYTGFTPVQLRFIRELMRRCDNVFVTVTLGREAIMDQYVTVPKRVAEDDLFCLSKRTISGLRRIAEELKIKEEQVLTLVDETKGRHADNPELAHLERYLFRDNAIKYQNGELNNIVVGDCSDAGCEAAYIARQIYILTHEQGYKYGDIAVLCGDMKQYERHFTTEFGKYNIPLFYDEKRDVLMNPFVEMIRSAADMIIRDFDYDSVFRYLRCSLTEFTPMEVDELENYVLGAGIKRKRDYNREWTYLLRYMNEEELLRLNAMRQQLVDNFKILTDSLFPRKKAKCIDMVTGLYDFIKRQNVFSHLQDMAEDFLLKEDVVLAKEYEQIYESVMVLFDRCADLIPDEMLTTREFMQILDAGFAELGVGVLPPGDNSVLIGDLERSRLSDIKILILSGCNDGKIPRDAHKTGILSELDREVLKEKNIELAPGTREQAFIQRFYLYMYLTKPTDKLYITYSRISSDSKALLPSYLVGILTDMFDALCVEKIDNDLLHKGSILTLGEGYDRLAHTIHESGTEGIELFAGLMNANSDSNNDAEANQDAKDKQQHLDYMRNIITHAFREYRDDPIRSSVCSAIFGTTLRGSVTRLEKYAECAYSHFLRYGLKLRERESYTFESRDLGSIYHSVLQTFGCELQDKKLDWLTISVEDAKKIMAESVEKVLGEQEGEAIFQSSRDSYNAYRIRSVMDKTAEILTYQLQKGSFSPVGYEIPIEEYRKLSDVSFADGGHRSMRLGGSIDRVDECESGNDVFVRVIDYKSGNKDVDLAAIYEGTSLQLIIYMNNAIEQSAARHPGRTIRKAGVLYYHIDDPVIGIKEEAEMESVDDQIKRALMMKGLVNADDAVTTRMDGDLSDMVSVKSDIISVEYTKSGELSKRSKVVSEDDFEVISEYIKYKMDRLSECILKGDIKPVPYTKGAGSTKRTACDYCAYSRICGFDESVSGYEFKNITDGDEEIILSNMREAVNQ